jgi:hypothetical protein
MADNKVMNVRIKLRSDLAANWAAVEDTFKPLEGEVIFYKDAADSQSGYYKVGDGAHYLKDLPWWYGPRDELTYQYNTTTGMVDVIYPLQPGETEPKVDTIPIPWGTLKEGAFTPVAATLDPDAASYNPDALVTAELAQDIGGGQPYTVASGLHTGEYNDDDLVPAGVLLDFTSETLNAEEQGYDADAFVTAGVIASRIDGVREDLVAYENSNDSRVDFLYERLTTLGEAAWSDVATSSDMDKDNPDRDTSRVVPVSVLEEINDALNERIDGLGDLDALHFKGVYDPDNLDFTPKDADVIITNDGKEYVYYNNAWHLFGDENAYVVNDSNYQTWVSHVNEVINNLSVASTLDSTQTEYDRNSLVPTGVLKDYILSNYSDDLNKDGDKIVSLQALKSAFNYNGIEVTANSLYSEGNTIGTITVHDKATDEYNYYDLKLPFATTLDSTDDNYDGGAVVTASVLNDSIAKEYSSPDSSTDAEEAMPVSLGALQDAMSKVNQMISVTVDYPSYDANFDELAVISITNPDTERMEEYRIHAPKPWYSSDVSNGTTIGTLYAGNDDYEIQIPTISASATLSTGTKIGTITVGGTSTDLYAPAGGSDVSVNPILSTGTKVAEITVNNVTKEIYAPQAGETVPPYEYLSQMTGSVAPGFDGEVIMDGGGAPI